MSEQDLLKQLVGRRAAAYVQSHSTLGLGSGSTASQAIAAVGARLSAGEIEGVLGVATSYQAMEDAGRAGIPLLDPASVESVDLAIDGADEVSPGRVLIKGGGAAHVLEKIVARMARQFICVVDWSKLSSQAGKLAPVPVAVRPQACSLAHQELKRLGGRPLLRLAERKLGPVVTDSGDFVVDCWFDQLDDPEHLEARINAIPGVVDNGLFVKMAHIVLVGELREEKPSVYEYEE